MNIFTQAFSYAFAHSNELLGAVTQHLRLVGVALGIGVVVCVPAGVWTFRSRVAALTVINLLHAVRVVPSLAILFLAIPYTGLTFTSAAIALTVLAFPPILINSDTALRNIDPSIREAAKSVGMNRWQQWWHVQFPLAPSVIMAGLRIAALVAIAIAIATVGAWFGAGGLGSLLFIGIAEGRYDKMLAGSIAVSALALVTNWLLLWLQHVLDPRTRLERAEHRQRAAEAESAALTDE